VQTCASEPRAPIEHHHLVRRRHALRHDSKQSSVAVRGAANVQTTCPLSVRGPAWQPGGSEYVPLAAGRTTRRPQLLIYTDWAVHVYASVCDSQTDPLPSILKCQGRHAGRQIDS
jgi:hypothetical protein